MSDLFKKRAAAALTLSALIAAGGGVAVAANGQAREGAPEVPKVDAGVALLASGAANAEVPRSVAASLREAATDPGASAALRSAASVDARAVVRVVESAIGTVTVVGTDDGVCVASDAAGVSCGPGPARTNLLGSVAVGESGESVVLFLVHDKVREVRVSSRDGVLRSLPVRGNVVAATVSGDPVSLAFVTADGSSVATLGRGAERD